MTDDYSHLPPVMARVCRALWECWNAMRCDNPADGWLEIIQEAEAALTAARQYRDWTPIDQIPEEWKDGRELLLYFRNGLVRLCFWDQARGGLWSVWPGREPARFPTHARLLPPPPPKEPSHD